MSLTILSFSSGFIPTLVPLVRISALAMALANACWSARSVTVTLQSVLSLTRLAKASA
ncbi:hypothetical protein D3C76_1607170 [compost metagenome]